MVLQTVSLPTFPFHCSGPDSETVLSSEGNYTCFQTAFRSEDHAMVHLDGMSVLQMLDRSGRPWHGAMTLGPGEGGAEE